MSRVGRDATSRTAAALKTLPSINAPITVSSGVRVGLTRFTLRPGTKSGSSADGFFEDKACAPGFNGGTVFCNAFRIAFSNGGSSDGSERIASPFSTVLDISFAVLASMGEYSRRAAPNIEVRMTVREGGVATDGSSLGVKGVGPGLRSEGANPPLRAVAAAMSFRSFVRRKMEKLVCCKKMSGDSLLVSRSRRYWSWRNRFRSE